MEVECRMKVSNLKSFANHLTVSCLYWVLVEAAGQDHNLQYSNKAWKLKKSLLTLPNCTSTVKCTV